MSQALPVDLINPSIPDLTRASDDNVDFTSPEELHRFWKRLLTLRLNGARLTMPSLRSTKGLCQRLLGVTNAESVLADMEQQETRRTHLE